VTYVGNTFAKRTAMRCASLAFKINLAFSGYLTDVHLPTVKRLWEAPPP